jgi:hypothetical protein
MPKAKNETEKPSDDFESVARRLGCDDDKERFEKKLGKIGRAKLEEPVNGSRAK